VQRFITDEEHLSEHDRLLQRQRDDEHASKAMWIGGIMQPSNWSEAKETVRTKATLTSKDNATLMCDLKATVDWGRSTRRVFLN
jgi:hypothetical protein